MIQDTNIIALIKGTERYVFLYDDSYRKDILRTLGRFASDPDLAFTWYDAAMLSQRIREQTESLARGFENKRKRDSHFDV